MLQGAPVAVDTQISSAYSGSQLCVLRESRHRGTERKEKNFVPLPLCAWLAVVHPSENRYSLPYLLVVVYNR
jgi:hypothetical protein